MCKTIMINKYFRYLHSWISYILIIISNKSIHIHIDLFDETLELFTFDVWYVKEDKDETLFLWMFYLV